MPRHSVDEERPQRIRLRTMVFDDLPTVYHIGEKVFGPSEHLFLYRTWETYEVTGLFASDPGMCIVACIGPTVVGFALGSVIDKPRSPWKYGYLVWIAVHPEIQSRALGARLYREVERRAIADGARMMIIDTEGTNQGAVRFFSRMGFRRGSTHLWMTKSIRARKAPDKADE